MSVEHKINKKLKEYDIFGGVSIPYVSNLGFKYCATTKYLSDLLE